MTAPFADWLYRPAPGEEPAAADRIGGKARNLARLASTGVRVPPWFVVKVDAFRAIALDGADHLSPDDHAGWHSHLAGLHLPPEFITRLRDRIAREGMQDALLAVRSSAVSEDGEGASFAGQFESVLGVRAPDLEGAILRVWVSAAGEHAVAYGGTVPPMAVIVQEMVDAEAAGVAFGADPVTGDPDLAVVSAVPGLGESLVSGRVDADTYRVDFSEEPPTVRETLVAKDEALRLNREGGTARVPLPASSGAQRSTLTRDEAIAIATTARRLGERFGAPQDIEWALSAGDRTLHILQTRPITTLAGAARGERRVWDNSNIVESYAGVTSPLTFSFALTVYEAAYRQFCAVVGVPDALIERYRHVFANMLGLVRGRVYYNLLNWYRTLALLPGYAVNRAFMERMMGVRQKLDDPPVLEATSGRLADSVRMMRMGVRLVQQSRGLRRAVPAFHEHVDSVLRPLAGEDLTARDADRLVALYRRLEDELLDNWQTPLVNDFFAMIWFGTLGSLVEKWLPDAPPTLVNDLLTHEGGIISTEPARRIAALTEQVRIIPAVRAHFDAEPDDTALAARLAADPACEAFTAEIDAYLEDFGDRCMNELKLETITLREDPAFLYRTIRDYLRSGVAGTPDAGAGAIRGEAEARVARSLGWGRRALLRTVLRQARARVRDRENLRFERTRVFGLVRRIFLGLGAQLHRSDHLEDPRDIFFLRVEEVFAHVEGTSTLGDLRALVALRKEEWAAHEASPAPPDRFESFGPVGLERWIVPGGAGRAADDDATGSLQGIGCCPGIVRGPVRLVRDPRDAGDLSGRILVAERTDPGWTLLFPVASGLLVERGSLLSHSAIVAREVGLPCIVSIPGLMETLVDGEMLEMDGTTGRVRRIDG